jgi:hypothetical protein
MVGSRISAAKQRIRELAMSDTYRRYRAIKDALMQLFPSRPTGHMERHVNTLAALICGIVGSRHTQTPKIADHAPGGAAQRESLIKRFRRWYAHEAITADLYFLPVAEGVLANLAQQPLVLIMDGSTVGRGCAALLLSVVYQGRALPLVWSVVVGAKGHFPAAAHLALLAQVRDLVPTGATVIFLGDGEFDSTELQATITSYGWEYVCRTAKNTLLLSEGEQLRFGDLALERGTRLGLPDARVTAEQYGPVLAIVCWDADHDEALYLVTNMLLVEEACYWYHKRFHIETFCSDQKSRGFHLHKSHVSDPKRLARLLLAACLAYLWIVYLGVLAKRDAWRARIHRTDRCDLSLFQLGLSLLAHLLKEGLPIPVAFHLPGQASADMHAA